MNVEQNKAMWHDVGQQNVENVSAEEYNLLRTLIEVTDRLQKTTLCR